MLDTHVVMYTSKGVATMQLPALTSSERGDLFIVFAMHLKSWSHEHWCITLAERGHIAISDGELRYRKIEREKARRLALHAFANLWLFEQSGQTIPFDYRTFEDLY